MRRAAFLSLPIVFLICLIQFSDSASAQSLTITWEVENRFRFYHDPSVFKYYASIAEKPLMADRTDWILNTEKKLQRLYYFDVERPHLFPDIAKPDEPDNDWNGWASLTRNETCRDRHEFDLTKFTSCEDYVSPVSHTVRAKVQGAASGALCQWKVRPSGDPPVGDKSLWRRRNAKINDALKNGPALPCDQQVLIEVPWSQDNSAFAEVSVAVAGINISTTEVIRVKDFLIVGMGDSFGAGVGNPDKPAHINWGSGIRYFKLLSGVTGGPILPLRPGFIDDNGVPKATPQFREAQSEWQDVRCFRSQYGPQFRAALHFAILTEHAAVTFLDLACNGGRIIEGLLSKKTIDRGYSSGTREPESQLGLASRILCSDPTRTRTVNYALKAANTAAGCRDLGPQTICEFGNKDGDGARIRRKYQNDYINKTSMKVCDADGANRFVRTIDALLLSIGGNDIGFAPMVADVIIDDTRAPTELVKALGTRGGIIHSGEIGRQRLNLLKSKYDVLDDALTSENYIPLRKGTKKPIFLAAYPLPLDDASGQICGSPQNAASATDALDISDVFSKFSRKTQEKNKPALAPLDRLESVVRTTCALNLKRFSWFDGGGNAASIITEITKPGAICGDQAENAVPNANEKNLGWQFIGEIIPKFRGHGFCAIGEKDELRISKLINGDWVPSYWSMHPYSERQRWVRTPNDAYVVTNWLPGIPDLRDIANLLSAATTTAMHPTAEGYAAIADALLQRVSAFLCSERKEELKGETLCK